MATANRVTVGKIEQVDVPNKKIICSYVAKVRGIVVSDNNGQWKFDQPEEARAFGRMVLAEWKNDLKALNGAVANGHKGG